MSQDNNAERAEGTQRLLEQQLVVMKKQLRLSRILTGVIGIVAVALLAVALLIVPRTVQSLNRADRLLKELERANLAETVQSINDLAEGSQAEISQTLEKLNQLDLNSLNEAIRNLESATRPLADLFGRSG